MQTSSEKVIQQSSHANNFDSLRLIFAVLVIFSHSFPLTRGDNNLTEPLSMLTHQQVNFGNISVWAFFVISGFLITQSWQRSPKVGKYLKRRIGRIYPGFAVAAILMALFVVPKAVEPGVHDAVSLQSYLFNTLRLQVFDHAPVFVHNPGVVDASVGGALNGSLWSVPYEFWCYLGVMTLGLIGLLRRRVFVVVLFALVIALHLFMLVRGWNPGGRILGQVFGYPLFWVTVLPFYLAGTIFQIYGGQKLLKGRWLVAAAIVLVVSNFIPNGLIVTAPVCGSYLLMGLAYWPVLHPLNLGRFGDFSYGTYLYAFPIQQLLVQRAVRAHQTISPWMLFAEAAPLTLIAGALSWHLVEKHFLMRSSQLKHEGISTLSREALPTSSTVVTTNSTEPLSNLAAKPKQQLEEEAYAAAKL